MVIVSTAKRLCRSVILQSEGSENVYGLVMHKNVPKQYGQYVQTIALPWLG
jgi:hypothetical protein